MSQRKRAPSRTADQKDTRAVKKRGRAGRPKGPVKKMVSVYFTPERLADLQAGSFRFSKPMTGIVEELVDKWAADNRVVLDETRRSLEAAKGPRTR